MPGGTTSIMLFYVYVLKSLTDDKNYVGFTIDLKRRLKEHGKGESFSTAPRRPFKLIYFEACTNEEDARRREKYMKTTYGRRFLAKRLKSFIKSK